MRPLWSTCFRVRKKTAINGNPSRDMDIASLSIQIQSVIYLRTRPTHLELEVNGNRFYMVHGFPGNNVHDEVWTRPTMESKNPIPDCRLIIGHTKVLSMIQPEEKRIAYAMDLEDKGEHLEILHTPGFVNLDCGCGYNMPIKALACIRLEDMCEFYA